MLEVIGHETLESFMGTVVPEAIRAPRPLVLPSALSEHAALVRLRKIIGENKPHRSYLGMGFADSKIVPLKMDHLSRLGGFRMLHVIRDSLFRISRTAPSCKT